MKVSKKSRCPKCGESFLDVNEATNHAKTLHHYGNYNIYDEPPYFSHPRKTRKQILIEKIEIIINNHSPLNNFETKESCAREIAKTLLPQ